MTSPRFLLFTRRSPWLLFFLFLLLCSPQLYSQQASNPQDQIAERAPKLAEIKSSGLAVENPNGLLTAKVGAPENITAIVEEENRDRRLVFLEIAKTTGSQPSAVAVQFAKMAAASSRAPTAAPRTSSTPPNPAPSPESTEPATSPVSTTAAAPAAPLRKQGTSIPLKILTRPFSSVYSAPMESASVVDSNVPSFTVFYVYDEQPGWWQIGKTKSGEAFGWMRAADSIVWKQNLVMEFTHPSDRLQVMFFREKETLQNIALSPDQERAEEAKALLSQIQSGNIPSPFPVEAIEPNRATDTKTTFYMLPITEFQEVTIDGRDGKLLRVAGVTRDRKNQNLPDAVQPAGPSAAASSALLDVVFVMDCTSTMQPFVNATKDAIAKLVKRLEADPDTNAAVRFGFWGYKDSPPDEGFNGAPVKNFTPELESASSFLQILDGVRVSSSPVGDYAEDVFGGMYSALTKTEWRPNSLRFVILVGDASGHPAGHPKNSSGMGESQLRDIADERRIYISAMYIERDSPLAPADKKVALPQFQKLAENRNSRSGSPDFSLLSQSAGMQELESIMNHLASNLSSEIRNLRAGGQPTDVSATDGDNSNIGAKMARNMFAGAYIDWLGRQKDTAVAPPGDVEAWVVDRDLVDPAIRPMDVKVLLQKNELDALVKVLDNIITAGVRGQVTGQDFFEALQSASASAVSSPDQIRNARNLAATGLLPDFLADLPYKSRLMLMDAATWNAMSVDTQSEILEQVQAKRKFYEDTLRDGSLWQAFNPGDSEDEKVAPVPLEQLP